MRAFAFGVFAAVSVGVFSAASSAAVFVNDNFDTYADQTAFEAAWPSISTAGAPLLDNTRSVSAPTSALVEGSGTAASRRSRHTFTETNTVGTLANPGFKLTWSFDFYDSVGGNPQRNFATLQDTTGGDFNESVDLDGSVQQPALDRQRRELLHGPNRRLFADGNRS
ncbi:MAG TPA: hypothetical protein VGR35_19520 [Tepidisphaeraceae bacterium]|nr:hypothetical protein [Tepidisphaeraceae bacterium]